MSDEQQSNKIDPETRESIKQQVLQEIKQEQETEAQQRKKQREEEQKAHQEYVERMKNSDEPWVEVVGMSHTSEGVKVELEWNDAFVDYLRKNGVSGTDDEQVVQRWVTLLLRDMADQMDQSQESTYE